MWGTTKNSKHVLMDNRGYVHGAAIERNSSKVVRGGQYGHQASRVETPPARPPARRRDFFAAAGAPSTT